MRSDDYGLSRLSCARNGVPQKSPGHRVHPGRRLIQEDDRRPANQSNGCTQLPLITATADISDDMLFTYTYSNIQAKMHISGHETEQGKAQNGLPTCSCGPVSRHEAPAAATSGHSPHSQTHTSLVFLAVWHTCSEFLFPSCGPTGRRTVGSNQCAAAPAVKR